MSDQLTLWAPARPSYTCPRCSTVTHLGVEFCPTHGWFPAVRLLAQTDEAR